MPFIDDTATLARAPEGVAPPIAPNPSLTTTIGAAFRQDNPLVNLYRKSLDEAFPPVEGYNPLDDIRGTDYEAMHSGNFVASRSPGETQAIKRRIDQEDEDRRTLAASGTAGFVAQVAAGMIDPTLALPGGVVVRSVKGGYEVGRSALSVGIAAAGQTAIQEAVLQGAQETRTAGESAIAIGSSAILGGMIGTGAAALLSRTERRLAEAGLARDRMAVDAHAGVDVFTAPGEGFDVFHGSPHDFEKFDLSKIGTGEGAQSYGHGLYFAENLAVAKHYQNSFDATVNGHPFNPNDSTHAAAGLVDEFGSRQAAVVEAKARVARDPSDDFYLGVSRLLESDREIPKIDTNASIYKVRIHADRDHFLDWDKPIREQSEFVKTAIAEARAKQEASLSELVENTKRDIEYARKMGHADDAMFLEERLDFLNERQSIDHTGGSFYNQLARSMDNPTRGMAKMDDFATAALREAGIPGIKYLDQGSRDGREGTRNLVLFDDKLATIMEKNGNQITVRPYSEGPSSGMSGMAGSMGAAATDTRQLEMFRSVPGTGQLSVTRRTLEAEAVEARRVMADLAETPYRFREGDEGVAATQGPALDRLARMEMNGTRVAIADNLDSLFSEYRFGVPDKSMPRLRARIEDFTGGGEGKMSFTDFKKEVSLAMQSGDQHAIPQVTQAAQFIRSKLFAPWADRAENAIEGFNKIEPAAGEGYFPHVWNKEVIRARRPEFTNRLVEKYTADQTTKRGIQDRLGKLSEDLKALRERVEKAKTPEERAAAGLDHDSIRGKIEAELAAWEGKSVSEAKSAIKAREKYATDTARDPDAPRLESADAAMDRAVKKILESERDLSVQELRDRASQTVNNILGSPDGRLAYDLATGGPRIGHQREPMPRGALAGRTLNVSNAWARDWIENDIEHVVAQHLRTVVPDVLLSERFGDVEMTQSFRKIEDAYSKLIDTTKSEKERVRLGKERDAVIRDVAAVRDRVRGVYGWSPELANMARVANAAKAVNNLTSMGSAALSSLPDMAGVVFRYGITGAIRDGWAPFFRGLTSSTEEWGKFKSQMRAIGIGVETAINARQHSLDDVVDVYRPQSRVERVLQGASDKFFIGNLLAPLTDAQKLIASHAAVSEIIRAAKAAAEGKATKRQVGNLAESGIDANMAGRIWREFGELKRGEITDGVHLPNTADWKDRAAADALNGAVAREVDIAVVTPGQEKPLWMSKPVISLLGQFKAFTAASTERILVANLQRRDAAALSGLVFSVGLGMLTYKLNSFFGGTKTSDRPQDWFKEGISRGGLLGWFEEGNALASKATRGSADIYRTIGADKPLSRFASRSAADMLLGPTWGKIESLPKITGAISSGEWSAADSTAVRRLIPGQNLFWIRGLLNKVEESANASMGVDPKPEKR